MGILADWQIKRDIGITPFAEGEKRPGVISYGLSSYGYDMRLGYKFRIIKPYPDAVIDPKNYREDMYELVDLEYNAIDMNRGYPLDIPAHSFVLGESIEEFIIPRDVLCIVMGKSTYARCGLYVNVTPGEPEWKGKWTIEISNTTPKTARVYAGEGICQCLFLRTDGITESMNKVLNQYLDHASQKRIQAASMAFDMLRVGLENSSCKTSYADKKGKYQNQEGITNPTVDKNS